ncbi:unnamed protein product [Acanthoscelides obtectus]|uniref:acid phosphatase n=1 Tax=Acanthoscelides obtectus TaxID=200917 RepID=A0A9P0PEP8_ACAOB|nr:unnamed protein product [Acanthoscelides obtectus]CAK1674801.1 Lysosomal acid phosphatase [Acanthoscelides obtectus]
MGGLFRRLVLLGIINLIVTVVHNVVAEDDELVAVALIFRHGDRTPRVSFPKDKYFNITYFPEGLGQLINSGKLRSYQLGTYIRQRYNTFISQKYKPQEIYVISSDRDRSLMSAEAMLAALYPPVPEDRFLGNLLWQPIPVHSVQDKYDNFIRMTAKCPKFDKLLEEANREFDKLKEKYPDVFRTIYENTGWDVVDIGHMKDLYTTMYVYRTSFPSYVPDWYKSLDEEIMTYLGGASFAMPTYRRDLQRLMAGPLFNYMMNHLNDAVEGKKPKFLVISGHDTTIAPALNTLGCFDYEPPEFSSAAFWEVYRSKDGKHYMKILYKKNSDSPAELIQKDGCVSILPLETFRANIAPVQLSDEDWCQECVSAGSKNLGSIFLLISCIVSVFSRYI